MSQRMPALFIGHGSPMNAIEDTVYSRAWTELGAALPRPRVILAISAHFYTRGTVVTAMEWPRTIHDFGGFPEALFAVQYPAPGDPDLAARTAQLLAPTAVALDRSEWGLDHGTWSILVHLYPKADIPVVQLSIDATLSPREHYALAQRLRALRDEGVLIFGSGNVVHNLRQVQFSESAKPADWALRFETKVAESLEAQNHDALIDYLHLDSQAVTASPTPEHYLPLLYVAAQQGVGEAVSFPVRGVDLHSISMLSLQIG